jgi:hypothetical protein
MFPKFNSNLSFFKIKHLFTFNIIKIILIHQINLAAILLFNCNNPIFEIFVAFQIINYFLFLKNCLIRY